MVYEPGARVVSNAASLDPTGRPKALTCAKAADVSAPDQSSFSRITRPVESKTCRRGFTKAPVTPKLARPGPIARTRTRLGCVPPITNPAINDPVAFGAIRTREERFASRSAGVTVKL